MTATNDQITALGKAARDLLQYAWKRKPRHELLVTNGLIAVAKTFATDPSASAALLRQAIGTEHLKEHGHKELRWIAQYIRTIAQADPDLAVDIYRAAYGYAETSGDRTSMGNSAILPLSSNKRQDYEGAWFQLSEALSAILSNDIETGARAVIHGLDGYVQRKDHHDPLSGEPATASFSFGSTTANFKADSSYSWYRAGGYAPVEDAPLLLKKFDEFLRQLAGDSDAEDRIDRTLKAISAEPSVVAAVWGSLLIAGTENPSLWARALLPLASAAPIMLSSDTRYQLGCFIGVVYEHLTVDERSAIERSILALPSDNAGERSKAVLAGALPGVLIATSEMQAYLQMLEQTGETRANVPPIRISGSFGVYDTDAYLASEGVSLEEPESAALRALMRNVEALSTPAGTADLTLKSVKRQLGILDELHKGLVKRFQGKVPDKLFEHATGQLAEAAGRIARAAPRVLAVSSVKAPLKRILLFCATSKNPHYNAKHEKEFHENLSWGGPSARTAAAHGLLALTRASKRKDPQIMRAIRKLGRDRMPEVRLQIIENLGMLRILDPIWAWSEVEHVLAKERTRGVVSAAICALPGLAPLDLPRSIRAAKGVMRRYSNKNGAGMASCRSNAAFHIFDIHIFRENIEADQFAASIVGDVIRNSGSIRQLVARYSDNLLTGSLDDPQATDNRPRQRTLAFYRSVTEEAFAEIEKRANLLDIRKFNSWPEADQSAVRSMFGILDEVSIRLHFAAGTHYDGSVPSDEISPERARLYGEAKPILSRLANASLAPIAHHLIQTLETFIPLDPAGIFELIARSVKSSGEGGYSFEPMAADLIVRIVERYLADYRVIFTDRARLDDLMDCLDTFVRVGWPAAQALTFKLGEIWR